MLKRTTYAQRSNNNFTETRHAQRSNNNFTETRHAQRSNNNFTPDGLPMTVRKLENGTYNGSIKDYKIVDTYSGKKLSFSISFTFCKSETVILTKLFDFTNSIIIGTPIYTFLNDLNAIHNTGRIDWDSLKVLPVSVEIKVSKAGNPYIYMVKPNQDEGITDEDEDDNDYDEDDDYEE